VDAEPDPVAHLVGDRRLSLGHRVGVRVERVDERGLRGRERGQSPATAADI
jgi:hypothetical protein